jgi:lipoprotein-anchoring transpeptidase ErfK/SrfK
MNKESIIATQALKQADEALKSGRKQEARHWAQIAVSLAPSMEEPWLILAKLANPRASIVYLEQALDINPKNENTWAELEQASSRLLNEKTPTATRESETSLIQDKGYIQRKPVFQKRRSISHATNFQRIAIFAIFVTAILAIWAGTGISVLAAMRSHDSTPAGTQILYWSQVDIPKPTDTASPAMPFTASPSLSPTLRPTAPPALTGTLLPTVTAHASTTLPVEKPVSTQAPAVGAKLILVIIHEQHAYAYQGSTLVYSFAASTGSHNNTLTGTYHILDKIPNAYDPDRNFWMPDWMGIYYVGSLEDGFHSLPLLANGQRLWADNIGTPVTDGCIVLGIADAHTLYIWAEVGTTVQIVP